MIKSFPATAWRLVYSTFTTQTAYPTLAPTTTKPNGSTVFASSGTRLLIVPLTDAAESDIRVVGWRLLGTVWYPELIIALRSTYFAAALTGDGTVVDSSLVFTPQWHPSKILAGQPERWPYQSGVLSPTNYQLGPMSFVHNGAPLIQIDAIRNGSAKANAVFAFV